MRLGKIIATISILTIATPIGFFMLHQNARAEGGPLSTGCAFGDCGADSGLPTTGPDGVQLPNNPVSDALGGGGTSANNGIINSGGPGTYNVFVTGMNRGLVKSLRQPAESTAVSTARETKQSLYEWFQSFVREALKKALLDRMVAEIIQWIQNGDEPRFVINWQTYLEDAGQVAAGDFAQQIGAGFLCEPFSAQLELVFAPSPEISDDLENGLSCTLDDMVGNIESFYDDFSNGGWIAYQEAWEPRNNIFGAYVIASGQRRQLINDAELAARDEALAGNGFLSPKACREAIGGTGPDLDKDGVRGDIPASCDISTPGSIVEELTRRAVTADIDFLISANQLSSYLAAIADAAFSRLMRDGINGLRGLSTDAAPDEGSSDENGCEAFPADSPEREACEGYINSNDENFAATKNDILADIDAVSTQYLIAGGYASSSVNVSRELLTFLEGEPERCTSQQDIDDIGEAIDDLIGTIEALDIILANVATTRDAVNSVPIGDWAGLTAAMQNADANVDIDMATSIAQAASLRFENITTAAALIRNEVNSCL